VPFFFASSFMRAVALPTLTPLLAGILLISVVRGNYRGWLNAHWLVYIGQRSYALYLWNFPLLWIGPPLLPLPQGVSAVLMLAAAWLLTLLSWKYVEVPFLARRHSSHRLGRETANGHAPSAV
jgi:peptidoglycan/LPS O-acetylase OafA/YrhL